MGAARGAARGSAASPPGGKTARARLVALAALVVCAAGLWPCLVSADEAGDQAPAPDPPIRRWFELENWTLYSRYRYVENSADVKTADQAQYKHTFRARVNLDANKRYTINVGFFTGSSFISTWDNTGVGTGPAQTLQFVKQLFVSATPIDGFEAQYGSIYIDRGVNTEITTYDDDGYLAGERITLRRPTELFFDEVSATRGLIGPFTTPAIGDRWRGLHEANYVQLLVARRFGKRVRASADYSNQRGQAGNDWLRAAVAVSLPQHAGLEGVRWEQYWRMSGSSAAGFALLGSRHFTRHFNLEAGYVTIDEDYIGFPADRSGWNADRIQRGRRIVFYGRSPIWGDLSIAPYFTHAFASPYAVALKNRFDLVVQYDLMRTLRRTGRL